MSDERSLRLQTLERDGFLVLPQVLGPTEVQALIAALEPWEQLRPMGRNNFEGERSRRVYSLVGKGEVFLALAEHPVIVELLEQLLMPSWLLSTLQSIRLYPGESEQPWHADDTFYPVARPHGPLSISTIWALEDFSEDNGATELIPGSHRWGMEHPDERPHTVTRAVMPAGSVVIFDGGLWHRGGANRSQRTRLCISPQYCQPWLRPQESQLLIAPPELARGFTPRMRSMLGYNIHPPFVGQVDGMHPLRLVDPAYSRHKTDAAEVADRVLERPAPLAPWK